jgi:hypothetical protein
VGGHSGKTLKASAASAGARPQAQGADLPEEFAARVQRLEPVFLQLESLAPVAGAATRPGMHPEPPRRSELIEALDCLLLEPATQPWRLTGRRPPNPRRLQKHVFALLGQGLVPQLRDRLMKAGFLDAVSYRYRFRSRRCRAASTTVTVLATYLWQCQPVRARYKSSEVYRVIGEIVQEMCTPSCFVCEKPHTFKDWRAVKARDQLGKGPWANRGDRWLRFTSRRSLARRE